MNTNKNLTRAAVVVGGAIAGLIVWALALIAGGIQVALGGGTASDMPWWQALAASLVVGGAGWALLAVLERALGARARRIWTIVALVVVVISLSGPIATSGISAGDRVWLALVHLALAAAYIPAMSRTAAVAAVPGRA
ncbi:MAG: DUF6069 family protein [Microbacterium sp.]